MATNEFDHDYRSYTKKAKSILSEGPKLENFKDRKDQTVFTVDTWKAVYHGKYQTQWRGMLMMKDLFSLVTYQQLIWDVKPRTIIEIGAYTGASAVWMADTMKSYTYQCHIYSLDKDFSLLEPLAKEKREDVTFLRGDCCKIGEVFTPDLLKKLPHPWFVTEDAHVDIVNVLHYLDQFTQPGDYVVVEDTNFNIPSAIGAGLLDDVEYLPCTKHEKLNDLKVFMKDHSERYRVDKRYTDFFGPCGCFTRFGKCGNANNDD